MADKKKEKPVIAKYSLQAFVKQEVGILWIVLVALGVGLLVGSLGNTLSVSDKVFRFNEELEEAQLYDFYYDSYLKDSRLRNPKLITREEEQKVEALAEIITKHAPPVPAIMIMFLVGIVLIAMFLFKVLGALYNRIAVLERQIDPERFKHENAPRYEILEDPESSESSDSKGADAT